MTQAPEPLHPSAALAHWPPTPRLDAPPAPLLELTESGASRGVRRRFAASIGMQCVSLTGLVAWTAYSAVSNGRRIASEPPWLAARDTREMLPLLFLMLGVIVLLLGLIVWLALMQRKLTPTSATSATAVALRVFPDRIELPCLPRDSAGRMVVFRPGRVRYFKRWARRAGITYLIKGWPSDEDAGYSVTLRSSGFDLPLERWQREIDPLLVGWAEAASE